MDTLSSIERKYISAKAELALIEEVRWIIVWLGAIVVHDHLTQSWLVTAPLAIIAFLLIPRWHTKQYNKASADYEKSLFPNAAIDLGEYN